MPRTFITGIAGEAQTNPDGITRQSIIHRCSPGDVVALVREPDNPYDDNAIMVVTKYGQIGYIAAKVALDLAADMDDGMDVSAMIYEIRGEGKQARGVWLAVTMLD